jgi:cytochrome c biogenesis protein CcdA
MMFLFVVSYLGGALTILSPCILPVLPFVFARADQPFVKSGLPMLLGMAITFAAVATLAAVGGGWAVQANQYGRFAAIVLLAFFGVTLLFPELADRLTRPLVAAGARLSQSASERERSRSSFAPSFLLGVATGLLWAPCAGPILGLVLTGAALQGANIQTSLLLLAYAAGAATSLALALQIGGRVFSAMKRWRRGSLRRRGDRAGTRHWPADAGVAREHIERRAGADRQGSVGEPRRYAGRVGGDETRFQRDDGHVGCDEGGADDERLQRHDGRRADDERFECDERGRHDDEGQARELQRSVAG